MHEYMHNMVFLRFSAFLMRFPAFFCVLMRFPAFSCVFLRFDAFSCVFLRAMKAILEGMFFSLFFLYQFFFHSLAQQYNYSVDFRSLLLLNFQLFRDNNRKSAQTHAHSYKIELWWNFLLKLKADKIWDELRPVFFIVDAVSVHLWNRKKILVFYRINRCDFDSYDPFR